MTDFKRCFTLKQKVWNWLNDLKFNQHVNLSSYVNSLIEKDMTKYEEKHNENK